MNSPEWWLVFISGLGVLVTIAEHAGRFIR